LARILRGESQFHPQQAEKAAEQTNVCLQKFFYCTPSI
jgi:hypothetical protein